MENTCTHIPVYVEIVDCIIVLDAILHVYKFKEQNLYIKLLPKIFLILQTSWFEQISEIKRQFLESQRDWFVYSYSPQQKEDLPPALYKHCFLIINRVILVTMSLLLHQALLDL